MDLLAEYANRIHWYDCDLRNIFDLEEIIKQVEVIIHCAALVSFDPKEEEKMYEHNVVVTKDLVNLALKHKTRKLIAVSSIAALGRYQDQEKHIDENIEWSDGQDHTYYGISKQLAEREVWRGHAEGLDCLIVNPALVLGAGIWDKGTPATFKRVASYNPFYPLGSTGVVDVRDVAEILVKSVRSEVSGQRAILSSANMTYREILTIMANALGKKPPSIGLTGFWINVLTGMDRLRATILQKPRLVTKENLKASTRTNYFDNAISTKLFQHKYRDLNQTIKESASIYLKSTEANKDHGILSFD